MLRAGRDNLGTFWPIMELEEKLMHGILIIIYRDELKI